MNNFENGVYLLRLNLRFGGLHTFSELLSFKMCNQGNLFKLITLVVFFETLQNSACTSCAAQDVMSQSDKACRYLSSPIRVQFVLLVMRVNFVYIEPPQVAQSTQS